MEWIPWSISAISLIVAILSFTRNVSNDARERNAEDSDKIGNINQSLIKVNMKLDAACQNISELRLDIKALNTNIQEIDRRVTILERDMQTAYIRIDELKKEA